MVRGQSTYQNYLYARIEHRMPAACLKNLTERDTVECLTDDFHIRVYKTKLHDRITYALKLFPSGLYNLYPAELLHFVEREAAYFVFLPARESDERNKHFNIKFLAGEGNNLNRQIFLKSISGISGFEFQTNGNTFIVRLKGRQGTVHMQFPLSYSLISGLDKKTLQSNLLKQLRKYPPGKITFRINRNKQEKYRDILIQKGDTFMIKNLNANIYLDSTGRVIFNKKHVAHSLANLFLTDLSKQADKQINLIFKNYDKDILVPLSLFSFLSFFDGTMQKFFGIEEEDRNSVHAVLVFYHPVYRYIHLLDMRIKKDTIFNKNAPLEGVFYTYIPQNNIKSFFGDDMQ